MADPWSSPGEPPPFSEVTSAPRTGRTVVIELSDQSDSNSDEVRQSTGTTAQPDSSGSLTKNLLSQDQALQDDLLVAKVELQTYKTLHAEIKAAHAESKTACADAKAACAGIKAEHAAMKAEHLKMQAERQEMQAERKEMKAEHKQMKAEHEKMMAEHAAAELDPYDTKSASGLPVVDKYDGTHVAPDVMGDARSPLEPSPDPYQDLPSPERSRTEFGELYASSEDPYRVPDPYELYRPYGFGPSPIRVPVEIANQQLNRPPASTTTRSPKSPKSFYVPFQESSSSPEALRDATKSASRKKKPPQRK